jgi:lysophospholipase L1-like esterase
MKRICFNIILLCFLFFPAVTNSQPFIDEINAFRSSDSIGNNFPGKHPIVFTGSSSIRLWPSLQLDFAGFPVLNRGFGGSTLPDMIRYVDDIIFKYYPKQVIIYCGENDLAQSDSISAKTVFARFKKLFFILREKMTDASIVFISIKPSPSRKKIQPKVIQTNNLIKGFLKNKRLGQYVDIYNAMLNNDGSIRVELFTADSLHMNQKGYAIWKKTIEPYLLK